VGEAAVSILGFALTLMLHASVLLGAIWLLERCGVLRHPAWAEVAWRGALFGSLLTASIATLPSRTVFPVDAATAVDATAPVASDRASRAATVMPETVNADEGAASIPLESRTITSSRARSTMLASSTAAARSTRGQPMSARALSLPAEAVSALAPLWLAGALALLLVTAWRGVGLLRVLRDARRAPQASVSQRRVAASIARTFGMPTPTLRVGEHIDSPLALPGRTVLLPRWTEALDEPESRALLAHEFAHLARRDPAWRVLQHLALAPLVAHPLAWFALRRLDALAEQQADAAAARLEGDGRPLAECLARCLAHHLQSRSVAPRFALAMAERPGAVVDRVQRLLEEDPMRFPPPSPSRTRFAIGLGLAAALFLPSLIVTATADSLFQGESISHHVDDDGHETVTIKSRYGFNSLDIRMEGEIEFAPDESDVLSMADDAEFEIEETRDGVTHAIELSAEGDGIARVYRREGKEQAFDADAKAWLARVLPQMFRSSGFDAKARAARIVARGGVGALLDEIALIETDHGRSTYLALLFAQGRLDADQQARALQLMKAIDSDYELRQALGGALATQDLAPEQQRQLLALATEIGSDYERAEFLMQALGALALDDAALDIWLRAADGIGSDYEHRRVLEAILEKHGDNPAAVRVALKSARAIGSDYERRQLLAASATRALRDPVLRRMYLDAAAEIGSDYERKEALLTLMQQGEIDADLALRMLDAIDGIGSDYERKEAMVALAQVMPGDASLIERYRKSARALSDHERGQAERALDRFAVL
jgi:Zn-dependent protease with chaperone function